MYIAHSKIPESEKRPTKNRAASTFIDRIEHKLYIKAVAKTLAKHAAEIAEIQKNFPGWLPVFKK